MSLNTLFTDIANAIRNKKGTTDPIVASNFPSEIESIETGGGEQVGIVTYTINYNIRDDGRLYISDGYQISEAITGQGTLTIVGGYALRLSVNGYGFAGGSLVLGGTNMDDFSHNFVNEYGFNTSGTVYMSTRYGISYDTPLSVTINLETYED